MYYYLIGISIDKISGARPPTLRSMLQHFLHFHKVKDKNKKQSATSVVQNAMVLWEKFNIQTRRIDKIEEKLIKEYEEWNNLDKKKNVKNFEERKKRANFVEKLEKVFSVVKSAPKRKDQDHKQKSTVSAQKSESMLVSDHEELSESTSTYHLRQRRKEQGVTKSTLDLSTFGISDSSPSNTPDLNDPNYKKYYDREQKKVNFITKHVVSTIDATGISDYQAARLLTAVAQGLGNNLEDLNVSRTTIQRRRAENRILTAETIVKGYKVN